MHRRLQIFVVASQCKGGLGNALCVQMCPHRIFVAQQNSALRVQKRQAEGLCNQCRINDADVDQAQQGVPWGSRVQLKHTGI